MSWIVFAYRNANDLQGSMRQIDHYIINDVRMTFFKSYNKTCGYRTLSKYTREMVAAGVAISRQLDEPVEVSIHHMSGSVITRLRAF